MDRRDFIRGLGAGTALAGAGGLASGLLQAAPAGRPDLAVASGASPERIVRAAVEALGGMRRFISRGDVVVLKPNIGWDRTMEQAANTNPEVVAALVRMALEAGAKTVKVFDRSCNDPRRCYAHSGIEAAAKAAGATVSHMDDRKFKDVAIKGEVLTNWPLYQELLEADKLINVPIAKHHSLGRLTLSLKNWMGGMGGVRGRIHQKLDDSIVDLMLVLKPTLTVLDAVRILTAHGPQGGSLADVKKLDTVVAGTDQVAVDAYGTGLFGLKPSDLPCLPKAAKRGMGRLDLERLDIRRITA